MAVLSELRYSARSLTRTPGLAVALLLTIAFGVGSNAAVHGFVRGLLPRDIPLPNSDAVVSVAATNAEGAGLVSYDDYVSIKSYDEVFEWVGAARESQGTIIVDGRSSMMSVAAVTSELALLFQLSLDERVVVSHRMRQNELRPSADVRANRIRIDGVDARLGAVAPEWLEGLYLGRPIDIWVPWAEGTIQDIDRSSRSVWVIARLRAGVSIDRAEALINAGSRGAVNVRLFPNTGVTPDMAYGLSRIGTLLSAAAAAVFLIACANVACLRLSRASARSQETAVRVALGASRAQLARQLLSDSVLISVAGGEFGLLLAIWTTNVVPSLFFDRDAAQLIFAPDRVGIVAVSAACVSITIACGLVPLFEIRDDRPAAVLQRENAAPSTSMRRLRMTLIVAQMALCCALLIATGLLLESLRSALQTNAGHPLRGTILATMQSRPGLLQRTASSGIAFFRAVVRSSVGSHASRPRHGTIARGDRPRGQGAAVRADEALSRWRRRDDELRADRKRPEHVRGRRESRGPSPAAAVSRSAARGDCANRLRTRGNRRRDSSPVGGRCSISSACEPVLRGERGSGYGSTNTLDRVVDLGHRLRRRAPDVGCRPVVPRRLDTRCDGCWSRCIDGVMDHEPRF